jgi:hypothetical protein
MSDTETRLKLLQSSRQSLNRFRTVPGLKNRRFCVPFGVAFERWVERRVDCRSTFHLHFSAWSPPFIIFTHRISGTLFACSPATMATLSGNSTSYGTARLVKLRRTENRESSTRNVQAPLPGHWCWRDAFDRHCPGNNICMRRNWVQSARMKQSSNGGISPRQLLMHCYARNLFDKIRTTLNL